MELKVEKKQGFTVILIHGRLDTTNYLELEKLINQLIDEGALKLVVDCSNMDYVSSSGLRVFLIGLKKMNLVQGRFVLCGLQETIREIFEIAGFNSIFTIYSDGVEAEQALQV